MRETMRGILLAAVCCWLLVGPLWAQETGQTSNEPEVDITQALPDGARQTQEEGDRSASEEPIPPSTDAEKMESSPVVRGISAVGAKVRTVVTPGPRGPRGPSGRPGRDAKPEEILPLVMEELEKLQEGEEPSDWAKPYFEEAKELGYLVGYEPDKEPEDRTYRPHRVPTREEMATVAMRLHKAIEDERGERIAADEELRGSTKGLFNWIGLLVICGMVALAVAGMATAAYLRSR